MLVEVVSNYTREASNTVKFKMFKVKVGHFLANMCKASLLEDFIGFS